MAVKFNGKYADSQVWLKARHAQVLNEQVDASVALMDMSSLSPLLKARLTAEFLLDIPSEKSDLNKIDLSKTSPKKAVRALKESMPAIKEEVNPSHLIVLRRDATQLAKEVDVVVVVEQEGHANENNAKKEQQEQEDVAAYGLGEIPLLITIASQAIRKQKQ